MLIKSAEFVKSATRPDNYPASDLPEVAFAGRSNVGKSSLINVLVNRKALVRTSSTPGRTQLLNFFDINGTFSLVDLPGYGFAKVPLAVKKDWGAMVHTFLERRHNLRAGSMDHPCIAGEISAQDGREVSCPLWLRRGAPGPALPRFSPTPRPGLRG